MRRLLTVAGLLGTLAVLAPAAGSDAPARAAGAEAATASSSAAADLVCSGGEPAPPSASGDDNAAGTPSAETAPRSVFHVAPDGRDDWRGGLPRPNADGSDGPFASIEAARDAARAAGGPARIVIGGGDYYLTQPIVFDARDAGLVLTAAAGEVPVLHGGPLVKGWLPQASGRWTASLALPPGDAVGALFVDGVVQTAALYPDAPPDGDPRLGWLFAAAPAPGVDQWQGNTRFRYQDGDLPEIGDLAGVTANIVGGFNPGSQWGNDTLPVVSIDRETQTIHTSGTSYFFTAEGSRYFLSGAGQFLNAPGEWWYSAAKAQLDYIPADASFAAAKVVAGVLPTLMRLDHADGMVISGLRFSDGAPLGTGKLGTDTRGFGAIRLDRSDGVQLVGNSIENVGVGIHVSESRNVVIAGNEIGHVAGNGIYVGTVYGSFGRSDGARIVSNRIHDVGEVYIESAGIWFQAADDIRIARNRIENAAQFGIAGGSLWGEQDSVHGAVIEFNEVRNANQRTADGGAIKLMGMQADLQNSVIRANVVTGTRQLMNRPDGSFWPQDYESTSEWPTPISWAIYTDGKASGVRIESNILSGNISGIGINGGWNNVVTGNVIAKGSGAAFRVDDGTGRDWRPAFAQPNRFENNVVSVASDSGLVASIYAPGRGAGYVRFAGNRYCGKLNGRSFQMQPAIMRSGQFGSLADFQAAGEETGSIGPSPPPRFRLFGGGG